MAKDKAEGKWRTKTLAEHKVSDTVKWVAQLSISPDGKKFAGVRTVAVKKDGTEVITRDGITFLYDAAVIDDNVDAVISMLAKLKGGTVPAGTKVKSEFVLYNPKTEKYLTRVVDGVAKGTTDKPHESDKIKRASSKADLRAFRTEYGIGSPWVIKEV